MSDADSVPEYFTVVCSTCAARIDARVQDQASKVKCPDCFVMVGVPSREEVVAHLARNFRRPLADVGTYDLANSEGDAASADAPNVWSTVCPICTARLTPDLREEAYSIECHDCYTKVNVPSAEEAKQLDPDRTRDNPNPGSYRLSLPAVPEYEVDVPMESPQSLLKPSEPTKPQPPSQRANSESGSSAKMRTSSNSDSVTCEKCGTALDVEPKRFTRRVTCDECGAKVSVPGVKESTVAKSTQGVAESTQVVADDDDIFSGGPKTASSTADSSQRTQRPLKKRPMKAAPPKKSAGAASRGGESDAAGNESVVDGTDDGIPTLGSPDKIGVASRKHEVEEVDPDDVPLDLDNNDDIPTLAEVPDDDAPQPRRKKKKKKRKKKKKKAGSGYVYWTEGEQGASTDYEQAPRDGFLAQQDSFRIVDDADEPPKHTYFSNVFEFPWNEPVKMRWVWMSSLLGLFGFAVGILRSLWGAANTSMLALPFICVVLVFLGIFVFGYVAANCMRIIEETAAGSDRIRTWPAAGWREWFPDLMIMAWFLGLSITMAAVPTGLVRAVLGADVAFTAFVISIYLMFPIMLLSSSEANSMIPVSLPILRSLVVLAKDWGCFFGLSFATTLPLYWILGSVPKGGMIYAYALAGPAYAAVVLINARLLGRLGWSIVQQLEPPEPDEPEDVEERIVPPL